MKKVNILGTKYSLILRDVDDDPAFNDCGGYRDAFAKEIVAAKYKQDEIDPRQTKNVSEVTKLTIRHEIVHAFLYESGLSFNSAHYSGNWAHNEEMVDWFAIQGPKIYAAWKEAGAL